MRIELIRTGGGFSLTETALRAVGREDVIVGLNSAAEIAAARRPILAIPAGGPWNFYRDAPDPANDAYRMIEAALEGVPAGAQFDVCIDCAGEGLVFYGDEHDLMSERFAAWGFDPQRTFLLTSRIDPAPPYLEWCARTGRKPILRPVYSPAQLYYVAGNYRRSIDSGLIEGMVRSRSPAFAPLRPKKFLSLNYSPREARWATLLRLMEEGLIDEGLCSFYGRAVDNGPVDASPSLDFVEEQLRSLRLPASQLALVAELDARSPLTLDTPEASRREKAYGSALQSFYADTYFSIVTESDFISQAGSRFTEKVLKPMLNLHPFVLVGTCGVSAELRRLGFRTFAPYINEGYDNIEDPSERLKAALAVAVSLIRMPKTELHGLYEALWPTLTHNFMHLLGGAGALVERDDGLLALAAR